MEKEILAGLKWGVFVCELPVPGDDRSLTLVYLNDAAGTILGLPQEELLGRPLDQVFPGLRAAGLTRVFAEVARSGVAVTLPDVLYSDDRICGVRFAVSAAPLAGHRVCLSFEDVTERKTAEEELARARKRLETEIEVRRHAERRISKIAREWTATFDVMPEYILLIEKDFRIRRVNRALSGLLGCEPADLIGRCCHEVMHGLDHPWPNCPLARSVEEDRIVSADVDDPRIGVPLQVTCVPYRDETGEIVGAVHVARDVSEHERVSRERETLIAQLQQALANVRLLRGLLPICSSCKKIRNDEGYWEQIESFIRDHSEAEFSHGICPDCLKRLYPDFHEGG